MNIKKLHPWLAGRLDKLKLANKDGQLSQSLTQQQTQALLAKVNQDYLKLQGQLDDAQVQFERLKVIVDSTPCTISWINDRLEYEGINETLLRTTNQSREDFLGKPIGFQSKDDYFFNFAKELFASPDKTLQKELASTIGGHKRYFWVVGSKYAEGKGAVFIGVETTLLKQTEMKLKNVEKLVDIDDLTGLYNMRSMYEKLENELARGQRYKHSTAVVMIDMDHFKNVNDNNDHVFGSFVLGEIGRLIKRQVRVVDFAARYGGDEFMIILPQAHQEGVEKFCERLRKCIETQVFKNENYQVKLTASFGYALCEPGAEKLTSKILIRVADFALYGAKHEGRNRVCGVTQGEHPEKFASDYKINYFDGSG
jgi:diguanylate cyclase (GGDEF)-like protein